jgi:hypothetical protein
MGNDMLFKRKPRFMEHIKLIVCRKIWNKIHGEKLVTNRVKI